MNTVLSIVMLAAIALVVGAYLQWRRGAPRQRIALMLLLAAIALINIAIWTLPDASGEAPLARIGTP